MSITRTTIAVDSGVLETAKQVAARQQRTLGQLVTEALQRQFAQGLSTERREVALPVAGSGGLRPGVNLNSNAELSAAMDEEDVNRW